MSTSIWGTWPRCLITLSSTCNLMPHREKGPQPPTPPWVIYDWGHANKNIKTIWALLGEIQGHCVDHARQEKACSAILWWYGCPVARPALLNRICSCWFFWVRWEPPLPPLPLTYYCSHKVTFVWTCAAFSLIGEPSWNPDPKGARIVFLSLKLHDKAHMS